MKKGPALKLVKRVQDILSAMGGGSAATGQDASVAKVETNVSISHRGQNAGRIGTNPGIAAFVAKWGLDAKCQDALSQQHPSIQQKIMNDFSPPNPDKANQMFMGFVKSRASNTPAPSAQAAFGGHDRASFGEAASATGDGTMDDFLAKWGLDAASQSVLSSLEPTVMLRVMNEFQPPNPEKANQMFMGFVKAVTNRLDGSGSAQKGGQKGGAAVPTGDATTDHFVSFWGLDAACQSVLCNLEPTVMERVMTDFEPPDADKANQMFMGFAKAVATRLGSPNGSESTRKGAQKGGAAVPTGDSFIDDFVALWGLDSSSQEALCQVDPIIQDKVVTDFQSSDPARVNPMFMGFLKSVAGRLSQNSWGGQDGCGDGDKSGMPPTPTGGPIDDFMAQWGLDSKAQEALLNLDIVAQQRVMSGFNPPNPDKANQMFMGFVKSVSKGGSKGGKKGGWGKGFAPY